MGSDRIDELLQKCLSAYEAGLTPEECLSAFPEDRQTLEPLFRQALSLRFAFAATPREEFRERAREKLLFTAGRDVTRAYASEPDPRFVAHTRQRLISRAGADAQEALRSVPPPRLAFWINARRRLLEAATISARPRPAVQPMTLALRRGLSAAVVVLALAVAGLAYITAQSQPQSVGAQVAQLEEQVQEVQEQLASGQSVAPDVLIELSSRSNALAGKLTSAPVTSPVAEKLSAIIDSQQEIIAEAPASPELQQVQQQLNQAEEKVRIVAARIESPIAQPSTTAASPTTEPTATTTPRPATVTPRPGPTSTPLPLLPRQVSIALDPSDTTYGLSWTAIRTMNLSFVIPTTWKVNNLVVNSSGIANLDSNYIFISGEDTTVIVNTQNGEIQALIKGGSQLLLRGEGKTGKIIELDKLIEGADAVALELRHLLTSLKLTGLLAN